MAAILLLCLWAVAGGSAAAADNASEGPLATGFANVATINDFVAALQTPTVTFILVTGAPSGRLSAGSEPWMPPWPTC
jgi:hypothetical protein